MADILSAMKALQDEFPEATVGVDADRPYARMPDGTLYGILFGEAGMAHAGDPKWARGPIAIVKFPSDTISARSFEVVKSLVEKVEDDS